MDGNSRSVGSPPDDGRWHRSLARAPGQSVERVAQYGLEAAQHPLDLEVLPLRLPLDLAAELLAAIGDKRREIEEILRGEPRAIEEVPGINAVAVMIDDGLTAGGARTFSIGSVALGAARTLAARFRYSFVAEWVGLLALIEDFVVTWDDPRHAPDRAGDVIYVRDGWRCAAPGCTSRRNLEDHHIVYRSRGGSNELSNRITLCRFHHQQGEHGDLMDCRGEASLGLEWQLGERGKGGTFRNERLLVQAGCGSLSPSWQTPPRGELLEWPNRAAC